MGKVVKCPECGALIATIFPMHWCNEDKTPEKQPEEPEKQPEEPKKQKEPATKRRRRSANQ